MSKRKLIVAGDSFCSEPDGWPSVLADRLHLDLICQTDGSGQPWWNTRCWLNNLGQEMPNCDLIVFAHTNAGRIPTPNKTVGLIDYTKKSTDELAKSVELYYKHLYDVEYGNWAQVAWFKEINERWGHMRTLHLHCFPWSIPFDSPLPGAIVTTNLARLSLNELGTTKFSLFNDQRGNHFNEHNNQALAKELHRIVRKYTPGRYELNIDEFEQKTRRWDDWF